MRLLIQDFEGYHIGGVRTVTNALLSELTSLGHVVTRSGLVQDLSLFDLVFVFSLAHPDRRNLYTACINQGIRPGVKAIFHPYSVVDNNFDPSSLVKIAKFARFITVDSPAEREAILEFHGNHLEDRLVITSPSVLSCFTSKTQLGSRILVHSNGRYVEHKGMAEVITACRDLKLPVLVAGAKEDSFYYRYCSELKYGRVWGDCDPIRLCNVYNKSRVYVCASRSEVCSTSVAEAVACGCRIVSTTAHLGNSRYPLPGYFTYREGNQEDLRRAIWEAYHSQEEQHNIVSVGKSGQELLDLIDRFPDYRT